MSFREYVKKVEEENTSTVEIIQYGYSKEKEKTFKPYLLEHNATVNSCLNQDYGIILTVKLPTKNKKNFLSNLPKGWQQE